MKTVINWTWVYDTVPGVYYILLLEDGTLWEGDNEYRPIRPFADTSPYIEAYRADDRHGHLDALWALAKHAAAYRTIADLATVKEKALALGDVDTKALLFRFLRQWGVTIYKKEYERDIYGIGIEVYSTDHGKLEIESSFAGYCARFTG